MGIGIERKVYARTNCIQHYNLTNLYDLKYSPRRSDSTSCSIRAAPPSSSFWQNLYHFCLQWLDLCWIPRDLLLLAHVAKAKVSVPCSGSFGIARLHRCFTLREFSTNFEPCCPCRKSDGRMSCFCNPRGHVRLPYLPLSQISR